MFHCNGDTIEVLKFRKRNDEMAACGDLSKSPRSQPKTVHINNFETNNYLWTN